MDGAALPLKRPALRYHGGKWRLAPWIVAHLPPHRVYVEPYGGAASVLLRKPRSYAEIYNDLDSEVVGLFRVLRDPEQAARLCAQLDMTPFARAEFEAAYEETEDPVERSRRLVIRSFMGHGSDGALLRGTTGFRANISGRGTRTSTDWSHLPPHLAALTERLRGVMVENRPAVDLIARHDSDDTLFYCDPPYVLSTRSSKRAYGRNVHGYRHEMSDPDHEVLADRLRRVDGLVVLSGYRSDLYARLYRGWARLERDSHADGAISRTEVLWFNERAWASLRDLRQANLFDESGAA